MCKCYYSTAKDVNIRRNSVSGGVFAALAVRVLHDNGVIAAVAYDSDLTIRYRVIDSVGDLSVLQGVKYAQGLLGKDVFELIDKALAAKRQVLFCGLPCQAAAVRKRYGEHHSLLICDLVCFGAPPHSFWRKYVDWLESSRGKKLTRIDPRDKLKGWGRQTYYRYEWADGKCERRASTYDPYAQAFYSGITFKDACFRCPFKSSNSRADITLGDGWGVDELPIPIQDIKSGVSSVMVRTDKGRSLISKSDVESFPVAYKQLLKHNLPIEQCACRPKNWQCFAADMNQLAFSDLVRKYGLQHTRLRMFYQGMKARVRRMIRL